MLRVCVSILTLLLVGVTAAADVGDTSPVLVLGDSLSAGYGISLQASWPSLLEKRLHAEGYPHSVVNASISGDTTAGGARRIDALMRDHAPTVVIVALGANDGLRGVAIAETQKNLETILRAVAAAGAQPVLLKVRIPPNYGPQYTAAFEGLFDQLGGTPHVIYGPFMLEQFAINRAAFQSDGLHPTAAMQPQILDTLWPSIIAALEVHVAEASGH